jgi:hypothetical protein
MDKNATIHSTGQARIWRLRPDRAAVRIAARDMELEALPGG